MYFLFYHVKLDTNNFADFFLDMENSFSPHIIMSLIQPYRK